MIRASVPRLRDLLGAGSSHEMRFARGICGVWECPAGNANVSNAMGVQRVPRVDCFETRSVRVASDLWRLADMRIRKCNSPITVCVGLVSLFLICRTDTAVNLMGSFGLEVPWSNPRFHRGSSSCLRRLRNVSMAIQNYTAQHNGILPLANGRPEGVEVSWRVEILPMIDRTPLYEIYDCSTRWYESPNDVLAEYVVPEYECPLASEPDGRFFRTTYVAVTGAETVWRDRSMSLQDVSLADGLTNTLLIGERHHDRPVWSEPRDSVLPGPLPNAFVAGNDEREPNIRNVRDANDSTVFSSPHRGVVNVMFADGHGGTMSAKTDPSVLRALLTADGGEPIAGDGF